MCYPYILAIRLIKVKAEHGEENVYTITITREESNDATLKELIVNGKDIDNIAAARKVE